MKKLVVSIIFLFLTASLFSQDIEKAEFRDKPITDILNILGQMAKKSIVTDETVSGNGTFYFTNTSIDIALDAFLSKYGYYWQEKNGIIFVSKILVIYDETKDEVSIQAEQVTARQIISKLAKETKRTILFDELPVSPVSIYVSRLSVDDCVKTIMTPFSDYEILFNDTNIHIKKKAAVASSGWSLRPSKGIEKSIDGLYSLSIDTDNIFNLIETIMDIEDKEYFIMMKRDTQIQRLYFKGKTFEESLKLILQAANADYTVLDNIYYFFEIQERDIVKKLRDSQILELKYITVDELMRLLPEGLSSSSFFIKQNRLSNSLLLTGSSSEIDPIIKFIEKVDIPQSDEFTVFHLSYLPADQFLKYLPQEYFLSPPQILEDGYSFLVRATNDMQEKIARLIELTDKEESASIIDLKYIKNETLFAKLPPSVKKEELLDSGYPGLIFYTGSKERLETVKKEIYLLDKPLPQIKYDLLVLQFESGDSLKWNPEVSFNEKTDNDAYSVVGSFAKLFTINFDVISQFGYLFATKLDLALTNSTTEVFADTSISGLTGQEVKFQNTSTYRYRDYTIDPDTGKPTTTGITRELSSGLILSLNGWVSKDKMITVMVNANVSERGESTEETPPTTSERVVSTQIRTQSGNAISVTGLRQRKKTISKKSWPIIGHIPFIGSLFSSYENSINETEFVILIIPRVIEGLEESTSISNEILEIYEEFL